jgi:acetylglutamate kinase
MVERAIEKAETLIEALGWIRQFRGKVTVIKLGGSVMRDDEQLRHVLVDIVFMETVGMQPVIVHGGGPRINQAMADAGIEARFIQGRRYTDDATLEIVERVLAYEVNEHLAKRIEGLGGLSQSLNFRTTNVLFGERIAMTAEDGQPVDLGHVGHVTGVDRDTVEGVFSSGKVPVIPSMCLDEEKGEKLNVNADTAATAVAQALGAEKLVFLSDINGVRRDKQDPESLVHTLTDETARDLIRSGAIDAGMIPKVEGCLDTLDKGVRKVHIVDGRLRHSLLLEVYTNEGVGTQIVKQTSPNAEKTTS